MRRCVRARSRSLVFPRTLRCTPKPRAQLVFLPVTLALPQLAALAVKDHPRAAMAPHPAIERGQAAPSVRRVAGGVAQDV